MSPKTPTAWWSTAARAGPPAAGHAFDAIVAALRALEGDETLLVQSGKPVGVFKTHAGAPARAHRQRAARAGLGDVRELPRSRGPRSDDVRADDRGQLDLHRHAGHPAGHLRDARRGGPALLRQFARRARVRVGGPRRDGWSAAARRDDERRRGARRRSRSAAHRAAPRDPVRRRGDRQSRRCAVARGAVAAGRRGAVGRPVRERRRRPAGPGGRGMSSRTC